MKKDIKAGILQSTVEVCFVTDMGPPLTRDLVVSGLPWDTEEQEIIDHFEVQNFLSGKVKMKAND